MLTDKEAAKYDKIREQVMVEFPPAKTVIPAKKTPPKEEDKLSRCYISKPKSAKLNGDDGMGEGFWIQKLTPTTAEVRNILMCGLGVGDIIVIKSYPDDGIHHPNEFVRVKKRVCEVCGLRYTFAGIEKFEGKFPDEIQKFINELRNKGIKFEGMCKGIAALQRPLEMSVPDFKALLSSGPIQFDFSE